MKAGHHRLASLCGALSLAVLALSLPQSQSYGQDAEDLKASLLYRLCQFVNWPPAPENEPFVIALVGPTEIEERLRAITADKRIDGRPIEIRRFHRLNQMDMADVVFVSEGYRRWTERVVNYYREKPTLTIGEYGDFAERGGIVALHFPGNRLALEINHQAAKASGVSLSPQLLAVAARVMGET